MSKPDDRCRDLFPEAERVTIYDIAEAAGVSSATVSRVINGSERVRPETRQKIEEIMRDRHYVVNSSAKSLVSRKTRTVGILVESLRNIHYMDAAYVAVGHFDSLGYACVLAPAQHSAEKHADALMTLAERRLDGLILIGSAFQHEETARIIRDYYADIPVLFINGYLEGFPNMISVLADEESGAFDAAEHLIRKGKRRLVFVAGRDFPSTGKKIAGLRRACGLAGIPLQIWKIKQFEYPEMRDSIASMLKAFPKTDGIIFCDDMIACAGSRALVEMGARVPEEIAYIGFNNDRYSFMANPQITTVDNRIQTLAEIGCNLLSNAFLDGWAGQAEPMVLPCVLIERETT